MVWSSGKLIAANTDKLSTQFNSLSICSFCIFKDLKEAYQALDDAQDDAAAERARARLAALTGLATFDGDGEQDSDEFEDADGLDVRKLTDEEFVAVQDASPSLGVDDGDGDLDADAVDTSEQDSDGPLFDDDTADDSESIDIDAAHDDYIDSDNEQNETPKMPKSFSRISDINNVDANTFPLFGEATARTVDLNANEMLYLPASWFHHVTSTGDTAQDTNDGLHVAVNFWFHPLPYSDDLLQSEFDEQKSFYSHKK